MIVLDTHIWIWLNTTPESVPARISVALKGHELAVSAISVWETVMLIEKGRVESDVDSATTVRRWLSANSFRVVAVDGDIALLSRNLPFDHDDPADRFISATAYKLGAPLATMDERLVKLNWLETL